MFEIINIDNTFEITNLNMNYDYLYRTIVSIILLIYDKYRNNITYNIRKKGIKIIVII